jgi:phosphoenolpyruvate synthase/pyruvate phosphate dikinase
MKANFWEYRFMDTVYKLFKLRVGSLEWRGSKEIASFLRSGGADQSLLRKRSSSFLYLRENGVEFKIGGAEAVKKHSEIISKNKHDTKDIQGSSASAGYAIGVAFVATHIKEALKIPDGQILVTGMTTPDYLPAMKKAKAIVTDEGGITCHAAIVSRELGIPCVVGTRNATKVIKSGDKIEVRANHGTVVIIEKAK